MRGRRNSVRGGLDAWPGYVDALSTLLMVIIFVLLVFVLAQAFLSVALNGREHVLDRLQHQMARLTEMLSLEHSKTQTLSLSIATLTAQRDKSLAEKQALSATVAKQGSALQSQSKLSSDAQAQVSLLNQQLAQLEQQLAAITQALDISQADLKTSNAKVNDLGNKLNVALADKVEVLKRYRSEFFGQLRQVLANQPGIHIVGDRFVFQSEVLFPIGSAQIAPTGAEQMKKLAATLKQIATQIPPDLHWILRVDGHADSQAISGGKFADNWQLSAARAIAVVKLLIAAGVAPQHLAATAFSSYQPIDTAHTPEAYAKNRRIELRLTNR